MVVKGFLVKLAKESSSERDSSFSQLMLRFALYANQVIRLHLIIVDIFELLVGDDHLQVLSSGFNSREIAAVPSCSFAIVYFWLLR